MASPGILLLIARTGSRAPTGNFKQRNRCCDRYVERTHPAVYWYSHDEIGCFAHDFANTMALRPEHQGQPPCDIKVIKGSVTARIHRGDPIALALEVFQGMGNIAASGN